MNVKIPVKKPRGRELTSKEKRYNKKLRKERVVVEHNDKQDEEIPGYGERNSEIVSHDMTV